MNFKVVIPARYASTRLPGKPLEDIAGKPMVARVAERALQSGADEVCISVGRRCSSPMRRSVACDQRGCGRSGFTLE